MSPSSFDTARESMAGLLENFVFGRVTSVKVPDPDGDYYHGYVKTDRGRAWFQQSRRGRRVLNFGPLELVPTETRPRTGDIVMGRLDSEPRGSKLVGWYLGASALKHFYDVCVNGTRKCESQLLGTMGLPDDDRVWALCRLLMFGNVGVFAREHTRPSMKLKMDVVEFVHKASTSLHDPSIWDEFLRLVPDARAPRSPEPEPEPEFVRRLTTVSDHAWGAVPLEPASPPYNPVSPQLSVEPFSPPYNPVSPPASPTLSVAPFSPPAPAQLDIATLSSLISQYCPPPVEAYDPCNPAYDSTS